jgi:orotate phosphoribosyltransferase
MLKELLEKYEAIKYGEFTLTSGKKSHYYVNVKLAYTDPHVLRTIAQEMGKFTKGYDRVAGMELGAVPIAVAVSMETGLPFLMIRKTAREHGTRSRIEGTMKPGDKVIVVEDVATTGGSLVQSVEAIRESGGIVDTAVVVVDREEGGEQALSAMGVRLLSCIKASQLKK